LRTTDSVVAVQLANTVDSAPEQVKTAAGLQAASVNALIVGALQQRYPV
jgi:hypothetical protein